MDKLFCTLIFVFSVCSLSCFADEASINMHYKGNQHTHMEFYIPADQPNVYLDTDNLTIIIDGGGEVSYYDVEIESMTTWLTVISTQVNGTYDTIDVSSLTPGDYIITITSPTGHEFEGYFEIE